MPEPTPAARRIQLGVLLRRYREQRRLTPKEVTSTMNWYSPVKVTKVEKGSVRLSEDETNLLIDLFQITGRDAERVREYATLARRRDEVARTMDGTEEINALLSITSEFKYYGSDVLPGFLQTEGYIRALLATSVVLSPAAAERRVAERIKRRRFITEEDPPRILVILDESVLWRRVGGVAAHRAQLTFLLETTNLPNVTIQVIPFETGAHVAMGGAFTLLHTADPPATFVYLEGLSDAALLDRPPHTEIYELAFERLEATAADEARTRQLIEQRLKSLK